MEKKKIHVSKAFFWMQSLVRLINHHTNSHGRFRVFLTIAGLRIRALVSMAFAPCHGNTESHPKIRVHAKHDVCVTKGFVLMCV